MADAAAPAVDAAGLTVDGRALPPPRFHATDWKAGARFTAADDPDRTLQPWKPASFTERVDPKKRAYETKATEIAINSPSRSAGSFARAVLGVLREDECAELIRTVNEKGFTPALLNIGGGRQQLMPHARDGHRVIADDPALASWLLKVLRPHLPEKFNNGDTLSNINERCRYLAYVPGQQFPVHCDGCYERPRGHPQYGDRSRVTIQLYLHDVPAANGGATTFHPRSRHEMPYVPVAGSVLLFTQDLDHEGSLVKAGLKYTMRSEVMYTDARASAERARR